MRLKVLIMVSCLAFVASVALHAQEYDDSSQENAYGYSDISFDSVHNIVTGYSETDLDPDTQTYYQARLTAKLTLDNGTVLASRTVVDPNENGYVGLTLSVAGSPSVNYTISGTHSGMLIPIPDAPIGQNYIDGYDFFPWNSHGIYFDGLFDFYPLGGAQYHNTPEIITLGATYTSATLKTPANCGASDQRNTIIQEYIEYDVSLNPPCSIFTQAVPVNFPYTFAQMNWGYFNWAILNQTMLGKMPVIKTRYAGVLTITSAYRDPQKEYDVAQYYNQPFHKNSRHEYGDAVDYDAGFSLAAFTAIRSVGLNSGSACAEPRQQSSLSHVHLDWRQYDGGGTCPADWLR